MPKSGEFYSFDEVLRRLNIDDQKLKKMVSEGEIRAFREGSEMKFRRSDIDGIKGKKPGSEDATAAIDLAAGGSGASETLTDDLIFDEGDEVAGQESGMATAEISSQDTFVDEGVGMSTEPLEDAGDRTMPAEPAGKKAGGRKGGGMPSAKPATPRRAPVEEEQGIEVGWAAALTLGALVLLGGMFVAMDVAKANAANSHAGNFAKWVGETFGGEIKK